MTKIKMCGITKAEEIRTVNRLVPAYIGFVFWPKSSRYVTPDEAAALKAELNPQTRAAGVFVNEEPETVAALLQRGVIDLAQLHGDEDEAYMERVRTLCQKRPFLIQAFRIRSVEDVLRAEESSAELVLLDAGKGEGRLFNWDLARSLSRPFLLAGGLTPGNAAEAVKTLHPYGLDVSSGIETDGCKDPLKMEAFARAVRQADKIC